MGCLILILLGLSPRVGVVVIWFASDWIDRAFNNGILLPILGIVLLPWTTALYTVGYILGDGATPWGWLGVIIGLFLDIALDAGWVTKVRKKD